MLKIFLAVTAFGLLASKCTYNAAAAGLLF
jgi:hypothetical protein